MFLTDNMPENCRSCPCADGEYGVCNIDYSIVLSADSRPKECPLRKVKHGKWTKLRYQVYTCSRCNRSVFLWGLNVTDENETKLLRELYPYCHCGAIMDGKEEE